MNWLTKSFIAIWLLLIFFSFSSYFSWFKNPFSQSTQPKTTYHKEFSFDVDSTQLGEGVLGSHFDRLRLNLKEKGSYLGVNDRPDRKKPVAFLSYEGKAQVFESQYPYLLSALTQNAAHQNYFFQVLPQQQHVEIQVIENNSPIFSLPISLKETEKEVLLDNFKLDSYILVRQKASWSGQDQFINDCGGEEMAEKLNRERIDFLHAGQPYSVYVKPGSLLVWKEQRWQPAEGDSLNYPLLQVKSVNESRMNLIIWERDGYKKEALCLNRNNEKPFAKSFIPLKFIGAKSANKWLVKSNKERFSIQAKDWLIHLGYKWEKINSSKAIERYSEQLNMGELFIVDKLVEEEGKKILIGTLYSSMRNQKKIYHHRLNFK